MGISTLLLSGDLQAVADNVARELGITQATGEMLPEDKLTDPADARAYVGYLGPFPAVK